MALPDLEGRVVGLGWVVGLDWAVGSGRTRRLFSVSCDRPQLHRLPADNRARARNDDNASSASV
jgi:hypothetical protein